MKNIAASLTLVLLGAFAATPALAQTATAGTKIAVINREVSVGNTKVGIYVADQLMALKKTIETEFEGELAPLRTQAQQLNAEISALSPETMRTRTDLQRRGQELRQTFAELGDWEQRQLDATRQQAINPVMQAYAAAVKAVIKEGNIQILIPAEVTVTFDGAVDVTDAVIKKIDAAMTTTPVNRVRVPRKLTPQQIQQLRQAQGR